MKLSIIIPCYNEQNTILELLSLVKNNSYKDIEIIVVDDNSRDDTKKILYENKDLYDLLIEHKVNKGKDTLRVKIKK